MNLLKNRAFCVLPFIEKFQNLDGKKYLCCYSTIPLDNDATAIAENVYNGTQVPHCNACYNLETLKVISPRLRESTRWLKDPEVRSYIDQWTPDITPQIFFYDLRLDNKCNLACISCNPKDSSLWAKELNIVTPKYQLNFDVDDCLSAKKIYLAGGEPLIINEFNDLIEKISKLKHQPELVINTNLTKVSDSLKETLSNVHNLTLTISVDAYDRVNEYHRWPMTWNKFLKNLNWAKEINCTIQFNSVVDAVTILNIHRLQEIESFADQWNLSIIENPRSLAINNLPKHLKLQAQNNFCQIKSSKFYNTDIAFKTRVDEIANRIMQTGDHILLSNYIKEIDQRRNIDHYEFLGVKLT